MEYTDQEARRLANIMVEDPHAAAAEMRNQLSQLNPQLQIDLIRKTKEQVIPGGDGDLVIQAETDENGCDTGFRNVTISTPDGPEQIAEIRTNAQQCGPDSGYYPGQYDDRERYRIDPFAAVAGIIIGGIMAHNRYDRYRHGDSRMEQEWMMRQQWRENNWRDNGGQWQQSWRDRGFREQQQAMPFMFGVPGMMHGHRHRDDYRGRDDYRHNGGQFNIPGIPGGIQLPRELRRILPNMGGDRNFDGRPDYRDQRRFVDPRERDPRSDMRRPDMRGGDNRGGQFDQQPNRQQMMRDQAIREQAAREQALRDQTARRGQPGQNFVPPQLQHREPQGRAPITNPGQIPHQQQRREVVPPVQQQQQQHQHHQRREFVPPPGTLQPRRQMQDGQQKR